MSYKHHYLFAIAAESDVAEGLRLTQSTEGTLRIMNDEIETMKTRLAVAKKEENAADRSAIELELKRQESEKQYFELLQQAAESDAASLQQQNSSAAARVKALEIEKDLTGKYEELAVATAVKPEDVNSYRDLLKRLLESQQVAADSTADSAAMGKDVAARRLKQIQALSKLQP